MSLSKIEETCSNDDFTKVNRNVQHLFTPPFRSRSPSLIPHCFCQNNQGHPGLNEVFRIWNFQYCRFYAQNILCVIHFQYAFKKIVHITLNILVSEGSKSIISFKDYHWTKH
ncbi:hypothetical protein CapIbe_005581 [Capra ibex]